MSAVPADRSRTVGDLIAWAQSQLRAGSGSARLDAELLLAVSAGIDRVQILAHPERAIAPAPALRFARYVERRGGGEPLAYIVGCREFYSLNLAVDGNVLVPRPETEDLVGLVLGLGLPDRARVLDLGTGSGAIALALAHARDDFEVIGADVSPAALDVARRNGATLGLDVAWLLSDWFAAIDAAPFDLIVSNPPYVRSADPHFDAGLGHEPRLALDGGDDGLAAFRALLAGAPAYLATGGVVAFEHGFDQRDALVALAANHGFVVLAAADDLAGQPRAVAFVRADER